MEKILGLDIGTLFWIALPVIMLISYFLSPAYKTARQLKNTQRKPIHRVRENEYAKIVGKAVNFETPLTAPISKRACVYYEVVVKRQDLHGNWIPIVNDILFQNFYIVADNDTALVNLNLSRKDRKLLNLVSDHSVHSGTFNDASEAFKQYLRTHSKKSTNALGFNKSLRYTERIIEINEEIAVMGLCKWKKQSNSTNANEKQLMLYGTTKQKLYITDVPKAMKPIK
ncbi:MAG: hypothetical protein AAF617_01880 [Bacteroidota bacterium]